MKAIPDRAITVALAVLATVLLATASFALTTPAEPGPADNTLPVIATDVTEADRPAPAVEATASPAAPPEAAEYEDAGDDDHETVLPDIRVEDDDSDDEDSDDNDRDDSDDESDDSDRGDDTKDGDKEDDGNDTSSTGDSID